MSANTRNCNLEDCLKEYQKEDRVKNIDRLTTIRIVTLEKAKINIKKAQEKQKYHMTWNMQRQMFIKLELKYY